ncbi:UvrD-helicase domain-containing protein [Martelella sp. FOR1707]
MKPEQWKPAGGLQLEPNALIAAKVNDRNLALTAGPGAGKTEMLAQRADFLLRTGTCRYPKRILAISFKVDASHNLKARVRKRCGPDLARRLDSHTFHAFAKRIIDRFRLVLTGQDALDEDYSIGPNRIERVSITFADMVPLAVQILETSALARNAIRQTYSHVFLDEFQDCTNTQFRLIEVCFRGTRTNLTAVGDTKQRIMGWAGALEGIFATYAENFDARPLNLYQNFRSKPRLRRMQNAMVRVMDPPAAVDDDALPGDDGEIEVLRYSDSDEEAASLADTVRRWIDVEGIEPSEIAILVSKQQNLYCQKLTGAFQELAIPFREEDNSQDLAAEPVAAFIVDFFLVVGSDRQPAAYSRLLEVVVMQHEQDEEREFGSRARWDGFVAQVRQQLKAGTLDLSDRQVIGATVDQLLAVIGRDAIVSLAPDYAKGNRLDQLIEQTVDRLDQVLAEHSDIGTALATFTGDRAVRIMSIHKSKGLEFDSVVLLGVENQTFWGEDEAERSAYFVGVSRAKRRLLLTVCETRERPVGAKRWTTARTEHEEFVQYAEEYR